MYKLDNSFARDRFTVTVAGCGGTGAFVAEGLCRFLPWHAELVLIDHDRVEERNLIRQNFDAGDLGKFKSEALAKRLAVKYRRPVAYSIVPVGLADVRESGVVIGCVDNGLARKDIENKLGEHTGRWSRGPWWVDAGNGENYGQIIIGNQTAAGICSSFDVDKNVCLNLPLPTLQRPEILEQRPTRHNCAQDVLTGEQGPVINQMMATVTLETVRRLIEGDCLWMQLYLDLEAGTLVPVLATPELVSRITGISLKKLERKGGEP